MHRSILARRRIGPVLALLLVIGLAGAARQPAAAQGDNGVTTITGTATLSNPFFLDAGADPFVLLTDLTAFVERDPNLPLPSFTQQVMTGLDGNVATGASFSLALPIAPRGAFNDVDPGEGEGEGVQVYSVDLTANILGDPFIGPFEGTGWATGNSSLEVEVGSNEVTGGYVVVWAPDDAQRFPTDFGEDGRLFTEDDPVGPIPAAWTVIDLNEQPFAQLRTPAVEVPIVEGDAGLKDLSGLSYTAAFDALVAELQVRYAFNDFKQIDWDAIIAEIRPQVEQAEQNGDADAFNVALMRFAVRFGDGHVGVDPSIQYIVQRLGGGLGLTLGETDDGQVIVRSVVPGLPAAEVGIEPGARVIRWNDQPVGAALDGTELLISSSSPHTTRLQALALITRMPAGTTASIRFRNPGGDTQTAELTAIQDPLGLGAAFGADEVDLAEMPVTVEILPSGIGYLRVNTFLDDVTLMIDAWEWSLERLSALNVPALIVDVRGNPGGFGDLATYFAGSFYDEEFLLAEEFFADAGGTFVAAGETTVTPAPVRWDRPVAVLIDENCASACEIFAAAMARNPDHLIVGSHPSAGVEAAVFPWLLPEGLSFQAPLGLLLDPEGNVFLEGTGVIPTVKVPITPESLLSDDDQELAAAEAALGA